MKSTTLKVPAEHFDIVKLGAIEEVKECAVWLRTQTEEGASTAYPTGPADHLDRTMGVLAQVLAVSDEGRGELREQPAILAHVLEQSVKLLVPKIAAQAAYSPLDGEVAEALFGYGRSLAWLAENAEALHEQAAVREAVA